MARARSPAAHRGASPSHFFSTSSAATHAVVSRPRISPTTKARVGGSADGVFSGAMAPTLLDMLWDSIATPGAGPGLIYSVNGSLSVFLAALAYFLAVGEWEGVGIHLAILCFLALGLLVSFNVFVGMVGVKKGAEKRRLRVR